MATKAVTQKSGRRTKWADIFANSDQYSDDMSIVLKDKEGNDITYSLGDLREYNEASNGELLASIETQKQQLQTESQNIEAAKQELLRQHNELMANRGRNEGNTVEKKLRSGKSVNAGEVADELGVDENDPIVGQVVRQLNLMKGDTDTKLKGVGDQLTQFQTILKNVLGTYLEDGYHNQYRDLESDLKKMPEKERKNYDFDSLKKYAEDNNFKDKAGRLDLKRAYRDKAHDFIQEQEVESRVSQRIKDRDREDRMRQVSKPGRPGDNLPTPTIDVSKSRDPLGDAMSAAMNDEELWKGFVEQ
jgi:hypothetical protein